MGIFFCFNVFFLHANKLSPKGLRNYENCSLSFTHTHTQTNKQTNKHTHINIFWFDEGVKRNFMVRTESAKPSANIVTLINPLIYHDIPVTGTRGRRIICKLKFLNKTIVIKTAELLFSTGNALTHTHTYTWTQTHMWTHTHTLTHTHTHI